jgi:PAS domain S-box-containing protein
MFSRKLKRKRDVYEQAIDKLPDGILIYSNKGTIRKINNAAIKLLGIEKAYSVRESEFFKGRFINLLLADLDLNNSFKKYQTRLNYDLIKKQNLWNTNRTGILDVEITPVRLGKSAIMLQVREIEKKQCRMSVPDENDKLFHLIAETAPVLIWMSGADKKCTYFNNGWLNFTGRKLSQELGDGWTANVHPEDIQYCFDTYFSNFSLQQPFQMEYRLRRYDGEYRWILDNGVPLFSDSNKFEGFLGTCVDITERKNAILELALSEDKFKRIFNNGPIGATISSMGYNYIHVNSAFCKFIGYKEEELLGKTFLEITHPSDIRKEEKIAQELSSGKLKQAELTKRYIRKDGKVAWGQISITLIRNNSNAPLFYFLIVEDITRRKTAERKLFYSEKKYRNLVETAPLGISIVFKQRIVYCNHKLVELLECDYKYQVENHHISEFIYKEDYNRVLRSHELREAKTAAYPFTYEHRAVTASGNIRNWKVFNTEFNEDEKSYIQSMIFDITEELFIIDEKQNALIESLYDKQKKEMAEQLRNIFSRNVNDKYINDKDKEQFNKILNRFINYHICPK